VATIAATTATAASASIDPPCTYGDASALFETFPVTTDPPPPPPCQYRLFFHNQTFTYTEDEFFLGGFVTRLPYGDNASRSQAIAELEATSIRVWLAEVTPGGTGPLVEQVVERTQIKSHVTEALGTYVWAQWGIIRQLPAGEYLSVTEHPPIQGRTMSTVRLVITPTP
jgi:hypothetical protein